MGDSRHGTRVPHDRRRRPGHDGRRDRRGVRPQRLRRRRRRADRRAVERGRAHVEHSTGRAVKRGKLSEAEQQAIFDRITLTTSLERPRGLRPRGRGRRRAPRPQAADLPAARRDRPPRRRARDQHVVACRSPRSRPRRRIPAGSSACTSSTRRRSRSSSRSSAPSSPSPTSSADVQELARKLDKNPVAAGDKAGFIANALLFGYLNHAVSMYESHYATREDIDAAMRLGCGYPMGPLALLDLIGLDTAYEILDTMYRQGRNRLHAPAPILKQMVTAGPARPQDRPRLLHLRGRRQPGRRRRRRDAATASDAAQLRRPIARVGVVGSGTMATGIVEVFAKAGFDVTYVTRSSREGRRRPRGRRPAASRRRSSAASSTSPSATPRSAALTGTHQPRRPRPGRPRRRGDRRGPRRQEGAVREPRRDLPRGRHPRHHDVVAAGDRARVGHRAARATSSACTSSTRRR